MTNIKKFISISLCAGILTCGAAVFADNFDGNVPATVNNADTGSTAAPPTETPAPPTEMPTETPEATKEPVETEEEVPAAGNLAESSKKVIINGTEVTFDDVGLMETPNGGTTFVPVRKIAEMLNCTVAWRGSDKTVHVFRNKKSVIFTINSPKVETREFKIGSKFIYTTNAEFRNIDEDLSVCPVIVSDRTVLPLRAVSELLGAKVVYEDGVISITDEAYTTSVEDIKAKNYIETYNYKPETQLQNGAVSISVRGNYEGAASDAGAGTVIKLTRVDDVSVTYTVTANTDGKALLPKVAVGEYKVDVTVPKGHIAAVEFANAVVNENGISIDIPLKKDPNTAADTNADGIGEAGTETEKSVEDASVTDVSEHKAKDESLTEVKDTDTITE